MKTKKQPDQNRHGGGQEPGQSSQKKKYKHPTNALRYYQRNNNNLRKRGECKWRQDWDSISAKSQGRSSRKQVTADADQDGEQREPSSLLVRVKSVLGEGPRYLNTEVLCDPARPLLHTHPKDFLSYPRCAGHPCLSLLSSQQLELKESSHPSTNEL